MPLSAQLKKRIESRIGEYVSNPSNPEDVRLQAARLGILPLFIDWEYFLAIHSDGEIIAVPTEEPDREPYVERDERFRKVALVEGSKKYPELTALISRRPPDAVECPHCKGSGKLGFIDSSLDRVICSCGGLGWLPHDLKEE